MKSILTSFSNTLSFNYVFLICWGWKKNFYFFQNNMGMKWSLWCTICFNCYADQCVFFILSSYDLGRYWHFFQRRYDISFLILYRLQTSLMSYSKLRAVGLVSTEKNAKNVSAQYPPREGAQFIRTSVYLSILNPEEYSLDFINLLCKS